MDCGGVLVKYILFIANILFLVCGVLLIVFGSIMVSQIDDLANFSKAGVEANSVPIAVLVLGCLIFLISFLGCCGAIRENSCQTMTYSVVMLVLFLVQLALITYVWINRETFLKQVDKTVDKIWEQRTTDQELINVLQISFECCGKNGVIDYMGSAIPKSCCDVNAKSCDFKDALTRPGCSQAVRSFWSKNTDLIRYAGLGVAVVELVAFIFGCCLANQVRNSRRRENY